MQPLHAQDHLVHQHALHQYLLNITKPLSKRLVHVKPVDVHHSTTHPVPLSPPSMTAVHPSHQAHIKCVLSSHISNTVCLCTAMSQSTLLTHKTNPGLKAMHKASVGHFHQTSVQLPAHLLQIIYIGQPSLKTLTHMQPLHALLNNMHQVYLCPLVCSISKPGLKRITQMLQAHAKNASLQLETHFNTLLHKTRPVIKRMVKPLSVHDLLNERPLRPFVFFPFAKNAPLEKDLSEGTLFSQSNDPVHPLFL